MTPKQVKALFRQHGVTVRGWAAANGFRAEQVYNVLNERAYGHRGESHRIAVALGIKVLHGAWPLPGVAQMSAAPTAASAGALAAAPSAEAKKGVAMSDTT
jgi:gp16 family phage-associated protein